MRAEVLDAHLIVRAAAAAGRVLVERTGWVSLVRQPLGTHSSLTVLSGKSRRVSPRASVASCTAAKHSLSAALRWPLGQAATGTGLAAATTRESRDHPEAREQFVPSQLHLFERLAHARLSPRSHTTSCAVVAACGDGELAGELAGAKV